MQYNLKKSDFTFELLQKCLLLFNVNFQLKFSFIAILIVSKVKNVFCSDWVPADVVVKCNWLKFVSATRVHLAIENASIIAIDLCRRVFSS